MTLRCVDDALLQKTCNDHDMFGFLGLDLHVLFHNPNQVEALTLTNQADAVGWCRFHVAGVPARQMCDPAQRAIEARLLL